MTQDSGHVPNGNAPNLGLLALHGYPELQQRLGHLGPKDQARVEAAYRFAEHAHQGVKRKSGEAYITHPVAVARILAELKLDSEAIMAGLLHDTVEDTSVTFDDIETGFGVVVRRIVEGETKVSKLSKLAKSHLEDEQAENLRQLLVAMTSDVRIIIVKLADRLHNMRTLEAMPSEKQKRIALETLEIYAPLAHRLGIGSLKWELEDLSFRYLESEQYKDLEAQIRLDQTSRDQFVERAIAYLRDMLETDRELTRWLLRFEISGRSKHLYSIHSKMNRDHKNLEQIFDLMAIRVILEPRPIETDNAPEARHAAEQAREKRVCYHTLGIVHSLWTPIPGRFKDYIAVPKPNGYQSLHSTVIGLEGQPLEVQIRTSSMHNIAEYGIAAHWLYKAGMEDPSTLEKSATWKNANASGLNWLEELKKLQNEIKDAGDFVDAVRSDILSNRVVVFTPKGDTLNLPQGATPIDLAYHVHTNVGHHAIGARINGQIVPLAHKLENGDRVEILTNRSSKPSKDWMGFATTRSARTKIRQYFRAEERQEALTAGHDNLARYLRKRGLPAAKLMRTVTLEDASEKLLGSRNPDDLYMALHSGRVTNLTVARVLAPELVPPQPEFANKAPPKRVVPSGVMIEGITAPIKFTNCCKPFKGDAIVGYITRGRGVSIHREDCPNLMRLRQDEPARCLPAHWENTATHKRTVDLEVLGSDRAGLLKDVLDVLSGFNKSALKVEGGVLGAGGARIGLRIEVESQTEFETIGRALLGITGVAEVKRSGGQRHAPQNQSA